MESQYLFDRSHMSHSPRNVFYNMSKYYVYNLSIYSALSQVGEPPIAHIDWNNYQNLLHTQYLAYISKAYILLISFSFRKNWRIRSNNFS